MIERGYKGLLICWFLLLISLKAIIAQELYTLTSLPFNTREYDDYAAVPYKNGLVFCSNRPQSAFIIRTDSANMPLHDFYFARKLKDGRWERNPDIFSKELNTRYNEGPMTFNKEGSIIYFTFADANNEGIYTSTYDGAGWGPIKPFPYNESSSRSFQPCLSSDGTKLFFASNRRGGNGKSDLWVCTWNGNQWGRPKNLGPPINSGADEGFPFYQNNKLYFSSNRPGGIGGYDIYCSKEVDGKWTKPVLQPPPINSIKDDYAYWSDSIDRHGYFSSDRSNRQKTMDVFEFSFNFPLLDSAKIQETNSYTGVFTEQRAMNIDTTSFIYEWDFGDGTKHVGKELEIEHTFPKVGDYLVNLNVIDTITKEVKKNQASNLVPIRDIEQPYITCPDTAFSGSSILFDAIKTNLPEFPIANYYWNFGDEQVAIGKEVKHVFNEPGVYKVILGITSTPDANNQTRTEARFRYVVIKNTSSQ